jgi:hypothetical protein
MQFFDLVFIASFLFVLFSCLRIAWLAVRRRRAAALWNLKRLGAFVATYLTAVIVVALFTPQRVFEVGDTRCFDDWCISVEGAKATKSIGTNVHPVRGRFLLVTLRVSSRASRVRQSEPHTEVELLDTKGNHYEVAEAPQQAFEAANGKQPALGTMLDPGGSFTTVRVFDIPAELVEVGLALRQTGMPGPGLLVIGDDASLFHKPSIFRMPVPKDE